MAGFDAEELLSEISPEQPAGDDLEYDNEFGELLRLAESKPEQQFGDTVIPGEEPDWRGVQRAAIALFGRTKDMRVAVTLAQAALKTDGFEGFEAALSVVRGLVERYWPSFYPILDPDDDNDPTARVNLIVSLADRWTVLRAVREAPLVSSRAVGRFALKDLDAAGQTSEEGGGGPEMSTIDAAFFDVPVEALQSTEAAVAALIDHARTIENIVTAEVGVANAPNLEDLVRALTEARKVLADRIARRGGTVDAAFVADGEVGVDGAPGATVGAPAVPGQIASRADVARAIERICDYYTRFEPSSPVPILLERARSLIDKNFMELIEDLAPSGASEFSVFKGNSG